jgi:hypothetical protein
MKNKKITKTKIAFSLFACTAVAYVLLTIMVLPIIGVQKFIAFIKNPVPVYAVTHIDYKREHKDETPMDRMSVQDKIVYYADIFGVDREDALRIAKCESGFNPKAENVNGSATGVYQFIRKTWQNYCDGDVYNADANIICFVRLYNEHPGFWECK